MSSNLNKVIVLAGQTGVGKTALAHRLARNINGEIILVDSIQLYKGLNICANKPSLFLTETVKYHNINEFELSSHDNINATYNSEKIRKILQDIWSRGKVPILEGGCGFYFKMFLTGGGTKFSTEEEIEFNKNLEIAREMIKFDNNFGKTAERLLKLDQSVPKEIIYKNDLYRLEKRLAEAITFGNGACKYLREKEEKIRKANNIFLPSNNIAVYNFFMYCERVNLIKKLIERCEEMIEAGLIEEVSDLIFSGQILPEYFHNSSKKNAIFLNAYGILETTEFFIKMKENIKYKNNILQAYDHHAGKIEKTVNMYKKFTDRSVYNFINQFVISNRQYAKRQALWFKNNEAYLWIDSQEGEKKLADKIINNWLTVPIEEFNSKYINSEENKLTKSNYNYKDQNFKLMPVFNLLKSANKHKLHFLLQKTFEAIEKNGEKLDEIKQYMSNKKGKGIKSNVNLDKEKLKKFLKMSD